MTEVGASNIQLHSAVDQSKVTATLTNITDAETFTVPHLTQIEDWSWTPTSAAADQLKATISKNVLTLTAVSSGSQDGIISVYGR